jgi:RNA polymerase sigma-70 factor (ECF subfamily)
MPSSAEKSPEPLSADLRGELAQLTPVPLGRESDEQLMRRAQQEDRQAFTLLYERYNGSLLSFLFRMLGNVEDVEATAQEAFLRAYRFRATYRYPQKFSTWLFTITRNLANNQTRRKKRSPIRSMTELNLEGADITGDPSQVAAAASDNMEKREQIARVLKAMDDLPPDQKEVIVMGIFQDLSYSQMEEITGTRAVTLRSRMFHALKKLAGRMSRDDKK